MPKIVITMTHPDDVSGTSILDDGTSILDDGTKAYWTEGFSDVLAVHPNGHTELIDAVVDHPLNHALADLSGPQRAMTAAETAEWDTARA